MNLQKIIPLQSYLSLFLRFLRFGLLAWGGPIAQIGMVKHELVEREKWMSVDQFNRTLAVFQIIPGPEAHELCVHFGMLARGRFGGFLAGLGFMLPGFLLMLFFSWLYVSKELGASEFLLGFAAVQAAVLALITRAVFRIGKHSLSNIVLYIIAIVAGVSAWIGVNFIITLLFAGIFYFLVKRKFNFASAIISIVFAVIFVTTLSDRPKETASQKFEEQNQEIKNAKLSNLFTSGTKAGLLTFGGAYTAIPFLQQDSVVSGKWMTNDQFLDGLALSGIIPAPLIIFGTFVGYLGGGFLGALLLTLGIFLPAFIFPLLGGRLIEKFINNMALHSFFNGIIAAVVGLIAKTTVELFSSSIHDIKGFIIYLIALILLIRLSGKFVIPAVILGAGLIGYIISIL